MIYFLVATFSFILLYVHKIGKHDDYYSTKWAMLLVVCVLILSYKIWKKYHWSAGLLFAYSYISAVNIFINYGNRYQKYNEVNKLILSSGGATMACCGILLYFLVDSIKSKDFKKIEYFLIVACLVDALYVTIQVWSGNYWSACGGLWANVSVNGVFIALLIPYVLNSRFKYFVPLPIFACLATKSSVSVGVCAVVLTVYFFLSFKNKAIKILVSVITFLIIFGIAYKYDKNLFSDSHRFKHQASAIAQWVAPVGYKDYKLKDGNVLRKLFIIKEKPTTVGVRYLIGWGAGTFPFHGIMSQKIYKVEWVGFARWAHSDWLQILLVLGIIGLLLSINLFFWCLWYARKDKVLFSQIVSFAAAMVFLYPVHYPFHAFLMMYFIKKSLEKSKIVTYYGYNGCLITQGESYGTRKSKFR